MAKQRKVKKRKATERVAIVRVGCVNECQADGSDEELHLQVLQPLGAAHVPLYGHSGQGFQRARRQVTAPVFFFLFARTVAFS